VTTGTDALPASHRQAGTAGGEKPVHASITHGQGLNGDQPPLAQPIQKPLRNRRVYAALDLGTNNCRLLVAIPAGNSFRVIDAFSRIVRLGEGLLASGRLQNEAMQRTIEALQICADKMAHRSVQRARLVATQACRAAANGAEFMDRVAQGTGLRLEIIDQETEARLAAAGCSTLADPKARSILLFDIGGGSTEIVWVSPGDAQRGAFRRDQVRAWASVPMGVVTLAERHGGIHVDRALFETMVSEVAASLEPLKVRFAPALDETGFHLLGTSGTVTTLAGIHLNLRRYDRSRIDGIWMDESSCSNVMNRLLGMDFEDRAAHACIGRERADLVLAGCAIFEAIRRLFPSQRIRIADRGLREGMLMQLMHEDGAFRRKPWRR
jgi:exopolyphosphatase / guanosine-5'-triphosphate,3'-diphosphate pyrophosphatase